MFSSPEQTRHLWSKKTHESQIDVGLSQFFTTLSNYNLALLISVSRLFLWSHVCDLSMLLAGKHSVPSVHQHHVQCFFCLFVRTGKADPRSRGLSRSSRHASQGSMMSNQMVKNNLTLLKTPMMCQYFLLSAASMELLWFTNRGTGDVLNTSRLSSLVATFLDFEFIYIKTVQFAFLWYLRNILSISYMIS